MGYSRVNPKSSLGSSPISSERLFAATQPIMPHGLKNKLSLRNDEGMIRFLI
ncbi:Hypothetical protein FKW44_016846 [Caligus rogercresseyi]|uniref:Uncharacterized protein n=1 Tax=Caligus rogercresseyi TaxID=217165 RepID=A0A7T8H2I5_CALRO|nr:Hypothetical protein FKW44_016846 [Caligus rogercresseyi]